MKIVLLHFSLCCFLVFTFVTTDSHLYYRIDWRCWGWTFFLHTYLKTKPSVTIYYAKLAGGLCRCFLSGFIHFPSVTCVLRALSVFAVFIWSFVIRYITVWDCICLDELAIVLFWHILLPKIYFAWNCYSSTSLLTVVFSHLFAFNQSLCLHLQCVSHREHMVYLGTYVLFKRTFFF